MRMVFPQRYDRAIVVVVVVAAVDHCRSHVIRVRFSAPLNAGRMILDLSLLNRMLLHSLPFLGSSSTPHFSCLSRPQVRNLYTTTRRCITSPMRTTISAKQHSLGGRLQTWTHL
jgi:hypothetical protein